MDLNDTWSKTLLSYQIKINHVTSLGMFFILTRAEKEAKPLQLQQLQHQQKKRTWPFIWTATRQTTMRLSLPLRLASSSSIPSGSALRQTPMALLPPIPLYRRILRAHRKKLPTDLRFLGDSYVKSEFRAHRNVENPIHIVRLCPCPPDYSDQLQGGWNNSLTIYYRSGFWQSGNSTLSSLKVIRGQMESLIRRRLTKWAVNYPNYFECKC